MEQLYLEIGKIVNTHGLRGDVKVVPWADYPEIFEEINFLYTKDEKRFRIKNVKYQKENVILSLEGISSIEEAQKYKNMVLYARRDTMPDLEDDTYFVADLINLEVIDENEDKIGKITDVFAAGGADVYTIKRENKKDLLIPAIKENIVEINIPEGFIKIKIPEGIE